MKLHPEEFDDYQIGVDTDITFCLKEARVSKKKHVTPWLISNIPDSPQFHNVCKSWGTWGNFQTFLPTLGM